MLAHPYDAELWGRFDCIAARSDVDVAREGEKWRVTIREQGNGHPPIVSAPVSLLEAVAEVITGPRTERRHSSPLDPSRPPR